MDRWRYECLINSILYSLKNMCECEYQELLGGIKTWDVRQYVAELKDIADGNL